MKDTFTITDEVISKKLHDLGFPIMNPLSATNIINWIQSDENQPYLEFQESKDNVVITVYGPTKKEHHLMTRFEGTPSAAVISLIEVLYGDNLTEKTIDELAMESKTTTE